MMKEDAKLKIEASPWVFLHQFQGSGVYYVPPPSHLPALKPARNRAQ